MTKHDYIEIEEQAYKVNRGVLAAAKFAKMVVLHQKISEITLRNIPCWEIIDQAQAKNYSQWHTGLDTVMEF